MSKEKGFSLIQIVIIIAAILIVVGSSSYLIYKKVSSKSSNSNNQNISETQNNQNTNTNSNESNKNNSSNTNSSNNIGESNIDYFKKLKESKVSQPTSVKFNYAATLDVQTFTLKTPLVYDNINKFAPFWIEDKSYKTWEDLLQSNTVIEGNSFITVNQVIDSFSHSLFYVGNRSNQDRLIKDCINDGDVMLTLAKFTLGMGSADYLGKEGGFKQNHEMLDELFKKFGTPTRYKYRDDGFLTLTFEYKDFTIYADVQPKITSDKIEYFELKEVMYYGGKTLDITEKLYEKNYPNVYKYTTDKNTMINEYLSKVTLRK